MFFWIRAALLSCFTELTVGEIFPALVSLFCCVGAVRTEPLIQYHLMKFTSTLRAVIPNLNFRSIMTTCFFFPFRYTLQQLTFLHVLMSVYFFFFIVLIFASGQLKSFCKPHVIFFIFDLAPNPQYLFDHPPFFCFRVRWICAVCLSPSPVYGTESAAASEVCLLDLSSDVRYEAASQGWGHKKNHKVTCKMWAGRRKVTLFLYFALVNHFKWM